MRPRNRVQTFVEKESAREDQMDTKCYKPDWIQYHGLLSCGHGTDTGTHLLNNDPKTLKITLFVCSDFGPKTFSANT